VERFFTQPDGERFDNVWQRLVAEKHEGLRDVNIVRYTGRAFMQPPGVDRRGDTEIRGGEWCYEMGHPNGVEVAPVGGGPVLFIDDGDYTRHHEKLDRLFGDHGGDQESDDDALVVSWPDEPVGGAFAHFANDGRHDVSVAYDVRPGLPSLTVKINGRGVPAALERELVRRVAALPSRRVTVAIDGESAPSSKSEQVEWCEKYVREALATAGESVTERAS
jgi:hypothetical protein